MGEAKNDMMQGCAALSDVPCESLLGKLEPEDIFMFVLLVFAFTGDLPESKPVDIEAMKELAGKLAEEMKKQEGNNDVQPTDDRA